MHELPFVKTCNSYWDCLRQLSRGHVAASGYDCRRFEITLIPLVSLTWYLLSSVTGLCWHCLVPTGTVAWLLALSHGTWHSLAAPGTALEMFRNIYIQEERCHATRSCTQYMQAQACKPLHTCKIFCQRYFIKLFSIIFCQIVCH